MIEVLNYSRFAFVVTGDTKEIAPILKNLGGRWNPHLKGGAAWIFKMSRKEEVVESLREFLK